MCVFCKDEINTGLVVTESKFSRIMANYFPMGIMSLMVMPKRHFSSLAEISPDELHDLTEMLAHATDKIRRKVKPAGLIILMNEGEIARQTVPHLHFHVIARGANDGLENMKRTVQKMPITSRQLMEIKTIFQD